MYKYNIYIYILRLGIWKEQIRFISFWFQWVCRFKGGKKAKALRSFSNTNACLPISGFSPAGSETSSSESPEEVGLRSLQLLSMSTVQHVRLLSGRHKWSMTCRPVGSTFTACSYSSSSFDRSSLQDFMSHQCHDLFQRPVEHRLNELALDLETCLAGNCEPLYRSWWANRPLGFSGKDQEWGGRAGRRVVPRLGSLASQAGRALGAGEEVECRSGPEHKLIFNIFSPSSLLTSLFQGLCGGGLDFNLFWSRYREWTKSCLVAWLWYICMLIWDLVKSCLLAKRIGTATFLCIPIVKQFLSNSLVKRIGTAALLHFIPIFYHNIHFKACTCGNTRQAGACYFRV